MGEPQEKARPVVWVPGPEGVPQASWSQLSLMANGAAGGPNRERRVHFKGLDTLPIPSRAHVYVSRLALTYSLCGL